MTWPPHPDDEWVEVTGYGKAVPEYLLARSGRDKLIGLATAAYVAGQISYEELEASIDDACRVAT